MGGTKIVAYKMGEADLWSLVQATKARNWMEQNNRFSYRCLPLKVANEQGWMILCPCNVELLWDGGLEPSSLQVTVDDDRFKNSIKSHFGQGIVTFNPPWFFRGPPNIGLRVAGPANLAVPGLSALEGLVEIWAHNSTWTMNWRVLNIGKSLMLPKGLPICHLTIYDFASACGPELELKEYRDMPPAQLADLEEWSRQRREQLECPHASTVQGLQYTRNVDSQGQAHEQPHWLKSCTDSAAPLNQVPRK